MKLNGWCAGSRMSARPDSMWSESSRRVGMSGILRVEQPRAYPIMGSGTQRACAGARVAPAPPQVGAEILMNVNVEEAGPVERRLHIEIPTTEVDAAFASFFR